MPSECYASFTVHAGMNSAHTHVKVRSGHLEMSLEDQLGEETTINDYARGRNGKKVRAR